MSNHITYKYIHIYVQVQINNQKFLKNTFRRHLCGYLTSTELKITEKLKIKGMGMGKGMGKLGAFLNKSNF